MERFRQDSLQNFAPGFPTYISSNNSFPNRARYYTRYSVGALASIAHRRGKRANAEFTITAVNSNRETSFLAPVTPPRKRQPVYTTTKGTISRRFHILPGK